MQENVLTYLIEDVAGGEFYVDLAESMSIVNRKLFRQQGLWKVDAVCAWVNVHGSGPLGMPYSIAIGGAPRTWCTRNGLVKSFEAWKDQQQMAYEATGSAGIKPKWQDFKVLLNENHRTVGTITPVSGHMFAIPAVDPFIAGEWVHSRLVVEQSVAGAIVQSEPLLHILGPDNGSTNKGIIENYGLSRPLPFDPDPSLPANIEHNIFVQAAEPLSDQVEEIIDNLDGANDSPPYDTDEYPGGATNGNEPVLYSFAANTSTLARKLVLNGFTAPNGLCEIQVDSIDERNMDIWLQFFVSGREAY